MTSAVPGNGGGGGGSGASTKKVPRLPIQNAPSPTTASGARTAPAAPLPRATSSDDNNGDGGGRVSLSGAHSAPPLTRSGHHQQVVPTCPLCKQRATTQWRYWSEHKEWIWHCSARNSVGAFCGVMWRSGRPRADCLICGLPLSIEEHNGVYGYWCLTCQDFSQ